jgi:hypothetical protein
MLKTGKQQSLRHAVVWVPVREKSAPPAPTGCTAGRYRNRANRSPPRESTRLSISQNQRADLFVPALCNMAIHTQSDDECPFNDSAWVQILSNRDIPADVPTSAG